MVDTTVNTPTGSTSTLGFEDPTLWDDLKITKFESDPICWNKDWNKALSSLSAPKVYIRMALPYYKEHWDHVNTPGHIIFLTEKLCEIQNTLVMAWSMLPQGGHIITAWLLLDEKERLRHLIKGFEDRVPPIFFGRNGRALAPDITTTSMLKRKGQAFPHMLDKYINGRKGMARGSPYLLPSEWWDNTLKEVPQPVIDMVDESTYGFLTLHRNIFITTFLINSFMSLMLDFGVGSPAMDPVIIHMKESGRFAYRTEANALNKPVIRCESCTKSEEDIGKDTKFMQCSRCKSRLKFIVHYCSVECQKKDWPNHKKHCGKGKVAKKQAGTIHDPFWFEPPMPDPVTDNALITSLGFPDPALVQFALPKSPALQRQISLLTADKEADYFIFDELDCPVRIEFDDRETKRTCRIARGSALSMCDYGGVAILMQYVIKETGQKPGLSRERIVSQFEREYGRDVVRKCFELRGMYNVLESMGYDFLRMPGVIPANFL